jgi:hypothetical protein
MSTDKDLNKFNVLRCLYNYSIRNDGGLSAIGLKSKTGMNVEEINEATKALAEKGLVWLRSWENNQPYHFNNVGITETGKTEFETQHSERRKNLKGESSRNQYNLKIENASNLIITQGNENTVDITLQISDAFKKAYVAVEGKMLSDQLKEEIRIKLRELEHELNKGKEADAGRLQKASKWLKENAGDIAEVIGDVLLKGIKQACGL